MFGTTTSTLQDALAAVETCIGDDYGTYNDPALADAVRTYCQLVDRVDALGATLLPVWDGRGIWALDGALTPGAWLRQHGGIDTGTSRIRTARKLAQYAPATSAALKSGELSYAKAQRLADAPDQTTAADFAEIEPTLVEAARHLPISDVETLARQWRSAADDAHDIDRSEKVQKARSLSYGETFGGMLGLKGQLSPEAGAAFAAAIDAKTDELFRLDVRQARREAGLDPEGEGDREHPDDGLQLWRTPSQRRADALTELVALGYAYNPATDTYDKAPKTDVGVTIPWDLLHQRAHQHAADAASDATDASSTLFENTDQPPAQHDHPDIDADLAEEGPSTDDNRDAADADPSDTDVADEAPSTEAPADPPPDPTTRPADLWLPNHPNRPPDPPPLWQSFGQPTAAGAMPLTERGLPFATLDGYARPLTREELDQILCDCHLTRLVLDANGVPLDIGKPTPVIPPHIRRALIQRDRGCACCGRPARWCDSHHIIWRINQGPTALDNLVLLCRRCHRLMHRKTDPYKVRLDPTTRRPIFTTPDGNTFHPPNPPPAATRPDGTHQHGLFA